MTNGDKVRSMSDEELFHFIDKSSFDLCDVCAYKDEPLKCNRNCNVGFLEWCKQECEE